MSGKKIALEVIGTDMGKTPTVAICSHHVYDGIKAGTYVIPRAKLAEVGVWGSITCHAVPNHKLFMKTADLRDEGHSVLIIAEPRPTQLKE